MNADHSPSQTGTRIGRAVRWAAVAVSLIALILLAGVGVATLVARNGPSDTGRTFGAGTILSALVFAALVVTFWVQFQTLRMQREELGQQRQSLDRLRGELYRSAEADLRSLHLELVKMSIDDPELAAVWPPLKPGLPPELDRKYLYANLIYQHVWLSLRIADYSERRIQNQMRYLFMSPIMRDYWRAAATARTSLVPGTEEHRFAQVADEVCQEYDGVLASAGLNTAGSGLGDSVEHWHRLDIEDLAASESISNQECPPSR